MGSFSKIISLSLIVPFLFSCFKKKEEPICITYKVNGYAECSYMVNIAYTDSTGKETWICTTNQQWSKTVTLPQGTHASLLAYPFRARSMKEWDIGREINYYETKVSLSAKIILDDRVMQEENGRIVSLLLCHPKNIECCSNH